MARSWIREENPSWDDDKSRILGEAPPGAFDLSRYRIAGRLPGEWWRVEEANRVVGYGWMDVVWGDAEVLLAVGGGARRAGVGAFILEMLAQEASSRGMRRMYNVVRPGHEDGEAVAAWLLRRGFHRVHESDELERPTG